MGHGPLSEMLFGYRHPICFHVLVEQHQCIRKRWMKGLIARHFHLTKTWRFSGSVDIRHDHLQLLPGGGICSIYIHAGIRQHQHNDVAYFLRTSQMSRSLPSSPEQASDTPLMRTKKENRIVRGSFDRVFRVSSTLVRCNDSVLLPRGIATITARRSTPICCRRNRGKK